MQSVLIIAGSAEAYELACALPDATVRLASRERVRREWRTPPRILSDTDFAAGYSHVIEAAHPVDVTTPARLIRDQSRYGFALCHLVRPLWRPTRRDRWIRLASLEDAAAAIPGSARVLVTVGRSELPRLKALKAMAYMRRLGRDPDHDPITRRRVLRGTGPFSVTQEMAIMKRYRLNWILSYNAGGRGGWPKIEAARRLGVRVAMIDRPARPGLCRVTTPQEALTWLSR